MDEAIEEGFDVLNALGIPDDELSRYDQPSEEDLREFQMQLRNALQGPGF